MNIEKTRILIGAPVLQDPEILREFLNSLERLDKEQLHIEYMFVDDNKDEASREMLLKFQKQNSNVIIVKGEDTSNYLRTEITHHWSNRLMDRVGEMKNLIIQYALDNNFDYLFFVDSDLVLNRRLLEHLISLGKDIVSEVFWTKWTPDSIPLPNVWLYDQYNLSRQHVYEKLEPQEALARKAAFIEQLKIPGIYKVGGLGACTLVSRNALLKGVSFSRIDNLRLLVGEDRFFCIRAAVLGLELFADTQYPPYHIYRKSDLNGVLEYISVNN